MLTACQDKGSRAAASFARRKLLMKNEILIDGRVGDVGAGAGDSAELYPNG
ncbi:MAG: hypothetical protein H0X14_08520 [Acidobacteria bacterium]|nr:hypothetical protein [Acidobacteriota bacterium]